MKLYEKAMFLAGVVAVTHKITLHLGRKRVIEQHKKEMQRILKKRKIRKEFYERNF